MAAWNSTRAWPRGVRAGLDGLNTGCLGMRHSIAVATLARSPGTWEANLARTGVPNTGDFDWPAWQDRSALLSPARSWPPCGPGG